MRWDAPAKVGFAIDSPLEGDGFEPSVLLGRAVPEPSNKAGAPSLIMKGNPYLPLGLMPNSKPDLIRSVKMPSKPVSDEFV